MKKLSWVKVCEDKNESYVIWLKIWENRSFSMLTFTVAREQPSSPSSCMHDWHFFVYCWITKFWRYAVICYCEIYIMFPLCVTFVWVTSMVELSYLKYHVHRHQTQRTFAKYSKHTGTAVSSPTLVSSDKERKAERKASAFCRQINQDCYCQSHEKNTYRSYSVTLIDSNNNPQIRL